MLTQCLVTIAGSPSCDCEAGAHGRLADLLISSCFSTDPRQPSGYTKCNSGHICGLFSATESALKAFCEGTMIGRGQAHCTWVRTLKAELDSST